MTKTATAPRPPVSKKPAPKKPVSKKAAAKTPVAGRKAPAPKKPVAKQPVAKQPVAAKQVAAKQPVGSRTPLASRKPPAPKKPVKNPVAAKTLEKLKARLAEERETYMRQAEDLLAEAEALMTDREPGDTQFDEESGEGDTINVERERDLALSASARQSVEEIDEALARMKSGTYGVCQRCGNRIPIARLEAVPQASLCIECKSRQERRR